MTAVAKLLPCPFCGRSNLIISRMHGTGDRYVVCQTPECKTCGPSGDAREDAIAAWNRRAALSPAELGGVAAVAWRFLDEDGKPTSKWADMDAKPMHYRDGMLTPGAYPGTSIQYAYTTPRAAEAVTEEMVERFCAAFFGGDAWDRTRAHHNNKLIFDQVRAALTAALTPRPSGR